MAGPAGASVEAGEVAAAVAAARAAARAGKRWAQRRKNLYYGINGPPTQIACREFIEGVEGCR